MQQAFDYERYEENFEVRQIGPRTWSICTKSKLAPLGCDAYLLVGDRSAIMVDSGLSRLNIKAYIDELQLTDKPILGVITTHSHFDHAAGNGYIGRGFMHPASEPGARDGDRGDKEGYILDYPIDHVHEGDTFDLGGRILEILEIPGHDPGSIAVIDHGERLLFTGDEVESGWANIHPALTLETHYQNMLKLKSRCADYDKICCGHHGSPISPDIIDQLIICDRMILDGEEGDPHNPNKNAGWLNRPPEALAVLRLMRYKSAHMCYHIDHIWNEA